jgi:hypothetical protein
LGDPERVLGAKPRGLSVGKGVKVPPAGWGEPIAL